MSLPICQKQEPPHKLAVSCCHFLETLNNVTNSPATTVSDGRTYFPYGNGIVNQSINQLDEWMPPFNLTCVVPYGLFQHVDRTLYCCHSTTDPYRGYNLTQYVPGTHPWCVMESLDLWKNSIVMPLSKDRTFLKTNRNNRSKVWHYTCVPYIITNHDNEYDDEKSWWSIFHRPCIYIISHAHRDYIHDIRTSLWWNDSWKVAYIFIYIYIGYCR